MSRIIAIALLCCALTGCSEDSRNPGNEPFTVIMVPDTQNAVNFRHQKSAGYVIDSSEIFLDQMRYIASRGRSNGGDVAFVASVGDVWEHVTDFHDADHDARGIVALRQPSPELERTVQPVETLEFEIPKSIEGYRLISAAGIPFGVAPGNHDYDAWFETENPDGSGFSTHIAGLKNFVSAFGSETDFFRDKNWYVGSYREGGNSAQVFSAGGYRFLHLALEMHPGDDVILWAAGVIDEYYGLPTIVSTHDYLNPRGERAPAFGTDLALVDPAEHNSAEELWQILISKTDQIFMVLSGHQAGQALRIDDNEFGHEVYQIMADFQYRIQAGWDAGLSEDDYRPFTGIGDGWLRELTFRLSDQNPRLDVRTYSSYYSKYASDIANYARWYRDIEQPNMTDAEFLAADEFTIELHDFRSRFGAPLTF